MSQKTLFVGWRSADWKILLPMIDAGKLHNLNRLIEAGVIGKMTSVQPHSTATSWTSVATGKRPHKHGILGNLTPAKDGKGVHSKTSFARRGKALWNILNQNGVVCQVVGWPASHPCDPISGAFVSEHFPTPVRDGKIWPIATGIIHPPRLVKSLGELRMHPNEIGGHDLLPFVPKLRKMETATDKRLTTLANIVASSVSIQAASTELMQTEPWDFHAVCFHGIEETCRNFMNYHPPKPSFVSEDNFEMYKDVVEGMYVFHDMMLGALVELAGDDASVVLFSDQGFHSGEDRHNLPLDEPGAPPEHKEVGVFVMKGPKIKSDTLIFGSSVLDLTPTLLHAIGLPIGSDMDGKVLQSVFRTSVEPKRVDSWDRISGDDGLISTDQRYDPLSIDLDFKNDPSDSLTQSREAAKHVQTELRYSLAESYLSAYLEGHAIRILEQLWREEPSESRYGYKLMLAYLAIGQTSFARKSFERILEYKKQHGPQSLRAWKALDLRQDQLSPFERRLKLKLWKQSRTNLAGMSFLHAWLLHGEGEPSKALKVISETDEMKVYNRIGFLKLKADCCLRLGEWGTASEAYQMMLSLDGDNAEAYLGLAKLHYETRDFEKSAENSSASIGLKYLNPLAHFIYGGSVFRCGQPARAAEALKIAVKQNPYLIGAFQRLVALYSGPLRDEAQAKTYRAELEEAQKAKTLFEDRRKHSGSLNGPEFES